MPDIPDSPLPTIDRLGLSNQHQSALQTDATDAHAIAETWLSAFSAALSPNSSPSTHILPLLLPSSGTPGELCSFWRDMLALTWDMRTFRGSAQIGKFLDAQVPRMRPRGFKLRKELTQLQRPFEDVVWVSLWFDFETQVGSASGIARLVPVPTKGEVEVEWKAHVVYTNLESLSAFPPSLGALRNPQPNHGKWASARAAATSFLPPNPPPSVLVIGAGQSGLEVAARLKYLSVPTLVVEKNERIGDNWRNRYEALCLHDPVWYDHMPYLPFPPTWPVYAPARKLANWLEFYADALELDVWTTSTITSLVQDEKSGGGKWNVTILRGKGNGEKEERTFTVNHVVFCTGLSGTKPNTPVYPGMDAFKGEILHSSEHKSALDHVGKKVVVVGACTSAHDICADYYDHGVDVTMFQRGSTYIMSTENGWDVLMRGAYWEDGPPVDITDRFNASFPHHMSMEINARKASMIAEKDRALLDALHKVGFRTNMGIKGTGFGLLAWSKAGGYYLDTGASQLVADGKIKLKNDSQISHFTHKGITFENGTEIDADVVVFATGLGDRIQQISSLCGSDIASRCGELWGLDAEGELQGSWKELGVKGLWYMMGNLALCRFHSGHLCMQIKAIEEGIFGGRYVENA